MKIKENVVGQEENVQHHDSERVCRKSVQKLNIKRNSEQKTQNHIEKQCKESY